MKSLKIVIETSIISCDAYRNKKHLNTYVHYTCSVTQSEELRLPVLVFIYYTLKTYFVLAISPEDRYVQFNATIS